MKIPITWPPRLQHDYASWDWTRTNRQLAEQHGVSVTSVWQWRRNLRKPKVKPQPVFKNGLWRDIRGRPVTFDYSTWDWNKTAIEIAKEHRVSVTYVYLWRLKLGKPKVKSPHKAINGLYADLDWTKRDCQLAREVGVCRERIRQGRLERGEPLVKDQNWKKFQKQFKGRKIVTAPELENCYVHYSTARDYAERMGLKLKRRPNGAPQQRPYKQMNWRLPNRVLADCWQIKAVNFGNTRARWGRGRRAMFWVSSLHGNPYSVPPAYQDEVDAEWKLADAWFAEKGRKQ